MWEFRCMYDKSDSFQSDWHILNHDSSLRWWICSNAWDMRFVSYIRTYIYNSNHMSYTSLFYGWQWKNKSFTDPNTRIAIGFTYSLNSLWLLWPSEVFALSIHILAKRLSTGNGHYCCKVNILNVTTPCVQITNNIDSTALLTLLTIASSKSNTHTHLSDTSCVQPCPSISTVSVLHFEFHHMDHYVQCVSADVAMVIWTDDTV